MTPPPRRMSPVRIALNRRPWLTAVMFSLTIHSAFAALFATREAVLRPVGSAITVEILVVDGPDTAPAGAKGGARSSEETLEEALERLAAQAAKTPPQSDQPAEAEPRAEAAPRAEAVPRAEAATAEQAPRTHSELAEARAPAEPPHPVIANTRSSDRTEAVAHPVNRPKALSDAWVKTAAQAAAKFFSDARRRTPSERGAPPQNAGPDTETKPAASLAAAPAGISRGAALRGDNPKPVYPRRAREKGQEGRVTLRVRVLPNGEAGEVSVVESSGHRLLDRAARNAAERWRFTPAARAGQAVSADLDVPVRFQLRR